MLEVGTRFTNPKTGASLEVLRVPGPHERILQLKRVLKPGTGKTARHVHMDFVERFVVEAGQARAELVGRLIELGPPEAFDVSPKRVHVNPYNAGTEDLVIRQAVEPASHFSLGYFETLGHLMTQGRTDKQGEVPLIAVFALAQLTRSQTFAAGLPRAAQRALLAPLGARLAKLRGYKVRRPSDAGE
ncbi:MAG TPA: hypothetical protein VGV36_02185 [Solirubrobacteraceae bacterium]|nr:hypothetical protein [Solirubrobacteraceae bacterium]